MAIVVSLRELDEKLQMVSQDSQVYLNKVTGTFLLITSDVLATLEGSGDDDFDGVPEWGARHRLRGRCQPARILCLSRLHDL